MAKGEPKGVDGKTEKKAPPQGDNRKKMIVDAFKNLVDLDAQKCKIQDEIREAYIDLKDNGLNAEVVRTMIRLKKKKPEVVEKFFGDLEEYSEYVQLNLFEHDASEVQH